MAREKAGQDSDSPDRYSQSSLSESKGRKSIKTAYRIARHGAFRWLIKEMARSARFGRMENKKDSCSCNCKTRIQALEQCVSELTESLAGHLAQKPTVFWSWDEITAYCRRPKRTLERYVKEQGFPVCRVGAFVISSPGLIDSWIVVRSQRSREKRARKTNRGSYMQRYWESRAATASIPVTSA